MNATMKKVIIALALLAPLGRSGFAADVPASNPEMVIVPYDASKPAAEQKPDQFYLPYERFLQLWQAAKQNRTTANSRRQPSLSRSAPPAMKASSASAQ